MTQVQKRLYVIMGAFLLIMLVITSIGKKMIQKEAESAPKLTLETTAAEFIGNGVVVGTDRSDPKLRDSGYEKVRVHTEAGSQKTQERDWLVVSPMAENFQEGEVVQLWVLDHAAHSHSAIQPFFFLCRRPFEVK